MLIVDDDDTTRDMLAVALHGRELEVTLCDTGRSALAAVFVAYRDGIPFDALVLDCALPYVDGFAVARIVRCAERQATVFTRSRIAFFTAYDKTVEKTTLLTEVEADAYWPKHRVSAVVAQLIEDFAYGRETPSFT